MIYIKYLNDNNISMPVALIILGLILQWLALYIIFRNMARFVVVM